MITTMSTPLGGSDLPKVRVDFLGLRTRRRDGEDEGIQCRIKRHQRSRHLIVVLDEVSQAHRGRSDVTQRQGQAPGELALDIQIPLHPVTATRIEFNMGGSERVWNEQLEGLAWKAGGWRRAQLSR